jgi:hypothetical protein
VVGARSALRINTPYLLFNTMHDSFLSYATEDNDFATELAFGLRGNGLHVWFAPMFLRVGDRLVESIE